MSTPGPAAPMDASAWDRRYDQNELVWSAGPNQWVEQVCADLPPGSALDLAAGEGRNAIWLCARGWQTTAVDFSRVALDRAVRIAHEHHVADRLTTVTADLATWTPDLAAYDLILLVYLQLPEPLRGTVVRAAAAALRPGGRLVVVAHHTDNLAHGHGGPSDPAVLYTAADVAADLAAADLDATGLNIDRAERVTRRVESPDGPRDALDALLVASRAVPH